MQLNFTRYDRPLSGICEICSDVRCGREGYVDCAVGRAVICSVGKKCLDGIAALFVKPVKRKRAA